jgi:hypothetical protein
MTGDLDWTRNLGNAVLAQRGDVMDSIQRLRKQAQDAGNLKSNEQMNVETETTGGATVIEIQPADPQIIYVPTYTQTVYAPPPPGPSAAGVMMGFIAGVAIASCFNDNYYGSCGFRLVEPHRHHQQQLLGTHLGEPRRLSAAIPPASTGQCPHQHR